MPRPQPTIQISTLRLFIAGVLIGLSVVPSATRVGAQAVQVVASVISR